MTSLIKTRYSSDVAEGAIRRLPALGLYISNETSIMYDARCVVYDIRI